MTDRPWGLYFGTGKDVGRFSTFRELASAQAKANELAGKKWVGVVVVDERTGKTVYVGVAEAEGCSLCGEPHEEGTCLL